MKQIINLYICIFVGIALLPFFHNNTWADSTTIKVNDLLPYFETKAKYAIVIENQTGRILYQKNIDDKIRPASLTKMLAAYVIFSLMNENGLSLEDRFVVTKNAYKKGGARSKNSTMFAKLNDEISLDNLLKGLIIQSANDAAITLAEGISGSEKKFAQLMNAYAKKIGMHQSSFANASGLHHKDQFSTVKDLAKLSLRLIKDFPDLSRYFKYKKFTWNNIEQKNRNLLLNHDKSVDGMKTGYLKQSGYSIAVTGKRKGTRLTVVLVGLKSKSQRLDESKKILNWAFRHFRYTALYKKDDIPIKLPVWGGKRKFVPVAPNQDVGFLINLKNYNKIIKKVIYDTPITAPIDKGTKLGRLEITHNNIKNSFPLYATKEVKEANIVVKAVQGGIHVLKNLKKKE